LSTLRPRKAERAGQQCGWTLLAGLARGGKREPRPGRWWCWRDSRGRGSMCPAPGHLLCAPPPRADQWLAGFPPILMRPASACPDRAAEGGRWEARRRGTRTSGTTLMDLRIDLVMVIHWRRPLQLCSCVLGTLHALASMRSMLCADVGPAPHRTGRDRGTRAGMRHG